MKYSQRSGSFSTTLLALMVLALGAGCSKKEDAPAPAAPPAKAAEPASATIKIGYSDWPGWIAFEIGIQKGWFKEAGVDIKFEWFEYAPSMEAFAAGKLDAVMMTMGDALVTGAPGARSTCILVTDYSNGNDMIVAKPGIASVKALKGKKIGLELGLVEHLLLVKGLEKNGLKEKDVYAGRHPDPSDGPVPGLGWRRCDRRLAAQRRSSLEVVGRLESDFHQRRYAWADLRPGVRQPEESGGATRRLGQGD